MSPIAFISETFKDRTVQVRCSRFIEMPAGTNRANLLVFDATALAYAVDVEIPAPTGQESDWQPLPNEPVTDTVLRVLTSGGSLMGTAAKIERVEGELCQITGLCINMLFVAKCQISVR
jgi:hypothetical protein